MTMYTIDSEPTVARERIGVAAGAAILVAGLILVAIVLPAEYGADPLGTGARLGLLELGVVGQQVEALNATASTTAAGQAAIIAGQERPFISDTQEFVLAPREGIEYKYRLEKGEALLYSWTASQPVNYELHAEPDGAPQPIGMNRPRFKASSTISGENFQNRFSGMNPSQTNSASSAM